jgi:hypothetical protein
MPRKKMTGNWKEDGLNLMSDQATNRNLIPCPPARCLGTRLTETYRHRKYPVTQWILLMRVCKIAKRDY